MGKLRLPMPPGASMSLIPAEYIPCLCVPPEADLQLCGESNQRERTRSMRSAMSLRRFGPPPAISAVAQPE